MKKIFYFLSFIFLLTSCTEDVKFNNPAFQGLKNNAFWRAQAYSAYTQTNGDLFIEGRLGTEAVILQLPSTAPKTYILGVDDVVKASFLNNIYSSEIPNYSTGSNKGSGQVVITEFNAEEKTISGTFKFTAVNTDQVDAEKPSITFTEGVFYKIPIVLTNNF